MRAIIPVSTISQISILMVGFNGPLRTSPCYLCPGMLKLVLPRVCVSGRILDILRRFSLAVSPVWLYV